jgi:hypothetical protein
MYDKPIWGLKPLRIAYSEAAVQKFESLILERRNRFKAEFKGALTIPQYSGLLAGSRFDDLALVLMALESNVQEKSFLLKPEDFIDRVLIGAAEADYHYKYEKEW